jgi:hypothetical protein
MFPIGALLDIGSKMIDKFFPDPAAAESAKLKLLEMQQNGELAQLAAATDIAKLQIQTNIEEAKSTNWFIAGWRPFVGWVCAFALGYVAVIEPIIRFVAKVFVGYSGEFPVIDTNLTMQVLMGLLGLGAMRSVEKVKGGEASR